MRDSSFCKVNPFRKAEKHYNPCPLNSDQIIKSNNQINIR